MKRNDTIKNAVIYARYSSERQNEQSIEGQVRVIKEFAEREGYNILDSYIDRALSGRSDDRPSFQKMIEDSNNQSFNYVLVYKLDRFSRSRYDSALYKKILQDNGVKVISATENIGENPEGIILEAILEGYSEYYSKELAQKITRGNYESRIKGLYTGGKVIYGYRIDENRKYVINDEEADIVRFIFDEVLNKKKLIEIAKELNDKGIVYSDGKSDWNVNKLSRLLRNEKYIGIARFHESVFDNIVPAIIDDSVFKEAGRLLDRNKHKCKMKTERRFLLSGKIFCGDCGSQLYGYSGTSKTGREYVYYKCKNAIKHNCSAKMVSRDWIEEYAVNQAMEYILSPENLKNVAKDMVTFHNSSIEDAIEIKALEKTLSEIQKRLDNSLRAIQQGIINESVGAMITSLEKDKKNVENDLLRARSRQRPILTYDKCYQFLSSFAFFDTDKEKNKKLILNRLVKKVIIYDERVVILFYPCADSTFKSGDDGFGSSGSGSDNQGGDDGEKLSLDAISMAPPNVNRT